MRGALWIIVPSMVSFAVVGLFGFAGAAVVIAVVSIGFAYSFGRAQAEREMTEQAMHLSLETFVEWAGQELARDELDDEQRMVLQHHYRKAQQLLGEMDNTHTKED